MSVDLVDLLLFVAVIVGPLAVALVVCAVVRVLRHRRAINRRVATLCDEMYGDHVDLPREWR